jgi:hypothetical protein
MEVPPTRGSVDALAGQAGQALAALAPASEGDRTYIGAQDRFRRWVDEQRVSGTIPYSEIYTDVENIELYFSEVVGPKDIVTPKTAKREQYALQRLADIERAGQEKINLAQNARVTEALQVQERLYNQRMATAVIDPHSHLPTDMISREESRKVIMTVLKENRFNWSDFCVAWTGSEQMMLRNHSMRQFNFGTILTLDTHGPRQESIFDREMLCLVYQTNVHKERQRRKRVVGVWRHRDVFQCFTSMVAMNIFHRLYGGGGGLHFFAGDNCNQEPDWWSEPLIRGWRDNKAANEAYSTILDRCNIRWAKVTHLRKAGVEFASATGELSADEIATMTKHAASNSGSSTLMNHYMTELSKSVLRVMAGFSKDDKEYFVWRTRMLGLEEYCLQNGNISLLHRIFPAYQAWLQERDGPAGDKSDAAKNFLDVTIPFLASVVVQDGIYWIKEFPDHEVSRLLLYIMPNNFPEFAHSQRQWVRQQEQEMSQASINLLDQATQSSFNAIQGQIAQMGNQVQLLVAQSQNQQQSLQQLIRDTMRQELQQQLQPLQQQIAVLQPPNEGGNVQQNPPPQLPIQQQQVNQAQPQERRAVQLRQDGGLVPPIPRKLPESFYILVQEHLLFKLDKFRDKATRRFWSADLKNRYSIRNYLVGIVHQKAESTRNGQYEQRLIDAAVYYDDEIRNGRSLRGMYQHFKRDDPSTRGRQRR